MKPLHLLLFLTLILFQNSGLAGELCPATLTYVDGSQKKITIEFPIVSNTKTITISEVGDKQEEIEIGLLSAIDFKTPNGKEYRLERIYVRTYGKKQKETFKSVNMVWAYKLRSHATMDYYVVGSEYQIRKKEKDLEVISKGAMGQAMHCFQRPGEEGATSVHSSTGGGVLVGKDKYFLNSLIAYFSDDPALCKRLEQGDFEEESLLTLYEVYCK